MIRVLSAWRFAPAAGILQPPRFLLEQATVAGTMETAAASTATVNRVPVAHPLRSWTWRARDPWENPEAKLLGPPRELSTPERGEE